MLSRETNRFCEEKLNHLKKRFSMKNTQKNEIEKSLGSWSEHDEADKPIFLPETIKKVRK